MTSVKKGYNNFFATITYMRIKEEFQRIRAIVSAFLRDLYATSALLEEVFPFVLELKRS